MSNKFLIGVFNILSADVIIQKILFKMDTVSIVILCSTNVDFRKFCNKHSKRIWEMLLQRDYPEFGIIGDPKQHYLKILAGEGEEYYLLQTWKGVSRVTEVRAYYDDNKYD